MSDTSDSVRRHRRPKKARSIKPKRGPRSETVSVRLDPKLRYLADLGARKQRRSLSSFIEWALENALHRVTIEEQETGPNVTVGDMAEVLWDVDEADRFVRLAFAYPELLDHDEQLLWKVIKTSGAFWMNGKVNADHMLSVSWKRENLHLPRLREHWQTIKAVAAGEAEKSALPHWSKFYKMPPAPEARDDEPPPDDDDAPF